MWTKPPPARWIPLMLGHHGLVTGALLDSVQRTLPMAAHFTPKAGEPSAPHAWTPPPTAPPGGAAGFWRRVGPWFGRLFRTVAWEARKRTEAPEEAESGMMTGAQLMVAGIGIAVFGTVGVVVMVGAAFDSVDRQREGFGSAIAGVVFYELLAAFGIWARELGAGREARLVATQVAARGVQDVLGSSTQAPRSSPWYRRKLFIVPIALIPLLIPIGAFALVDTPTTTVPSVVGMRLDAAHRKMAEVDLLTYTDADVIGPGRAVMVDHNWVVLEQSPAAGMAEVNSNTEIRLGVGKVDDLEIRDRLPVDAPVMLELAAAERKVADEQAEKAARAAKETAVKAAEPPTASTPPTKALTQTELTAYGAIREAWDAKHTQVAGSTPGAAFLPMVNGDQPKYSGVSGESGERILIYSINFPAGTSLALAKATTLSEFPPGARFGVQDTDEPECLIIEVRSSQVEAILDGSRPRVTFFTDAEISDIFVPSHVGDALMSFTSADRTDLGGC